jgi:hypothetical protein
MSIHPSNHIIIINMFYILITFVIIVILITMFIIIIIHHNHHHFSPFITVTIITLTMIYLLLGIKTRSSACSIDPHLHNDRGIECSRAGGCLYCYSIIITNYHHHSYHHHPHNNHHHYDRWVRSVSILIIRLAVTILL